MAVLLLRLFSLVKEQAHASKLICIPWRHHKHYAQRSRAIRTNKRGNGAGSRTSWRVQHETGEGSTQRERPRGGFGQGRLHSPHTEGARPSTTPTDGTCAFLDTTVLVSLHRSGIVHASPAGVRVQGRALILDMAFTYKYLSSSEMPRWRMACSLLSSVCAPSMRCPAPTGHDEGTLSTGNTRANTLGYLCRSYP